MITKLLHKFTTFCAMHERVTKTYRISAFTLYYTVSHSVTLLHVLQCEQWNVLCSPLSYLGSPGTTSIEKLVLVLSIRPLHQQWRYNHFLETENCGFLRLILTTFVKKKNPKNVGKGLKFYRQILPNPIKTAQKKFLKPCKYGCSDVRKGLVSYRKLGFRSLQSLV